MIDYKTALELVRKKHKNDLVRSVFEYDEKYIFSISLGKKYYKYDPSTFHISISFKDGKYELYDYWAEMLMNNDKKFDEALKNIRAIDIPQEDLS